MSGLIRVILADDHLLLRDMLAERLNALPDMRVVAACGNADEALVEARRHRPDVVILDIDMPGKLVFEAARAMRTELPDTRVLFLSAFFNDRFIEQALEVKAAGYLTKGEAPESVAQAIRKVHAGQVCFSPEVKRRIVIESDGVRLSSAPSTRIATLSNRELEVLRYLARAMSRKEIAQVMALSLHTVDRHTTNLMNKLDIHDRTRLCRFAIREGLAEA
jgi:DNA-binding NarL/FixJ family response regulator